MARDMLTGTRIRERRSALGMKQAALAEEAGISASYLNLIEHNRRRIGGKLLITIARILEVDPAALTEGAESHLVAALRVAADGAHGVQPEVERVEEFAGRFPGWAGLVAEQSERGTEQARTIHALTDRLAHDPQLAAALHEILSTVTAIRSTAGILAEDPDIAPEWRARFHRNINEEAARLSDSSTELVRYLEADQQSGPATPQEEVAAFLDESDHVLAALEAGASVDALLGQTGGAFTDAGRDMLRSYLYRYARDARRLPAEVLARERANLGDDPAALAARCDMPLDTVLHRLSLQVDAQAGLMMCNSGGMITYCRSLPQLVLPSFGTAATVWPLFAALSQPGQPMHRYVVQSGREDRFFETFSVASVVGAPVFDATPKLEGIMMIRAIAKTDVPEGAEALPLAGF